jgi:hypothetical protein
MMLELRARSYESARRRATGDETTEDETGTHGSAVQRDEQESIVVR